MLAIPPAARYIELSVQELDIRSSQSRGAGGYLVTIS